MNSVSMSSRIAASKAINNALVTLRPSSTRGHADHGWLNTHHTFSFAGWHDDKYMGFNSLRVLNEDRVEPGRGFGSHPHQNYEIFSYVVRGSLRHQDNLGNTETMGRGAVQFTSAGTGVYHSEYNGSDKEMVHFLQMWVRPSARGLKPGYQTKTFDDADKRGKLKRIVAPVEAKDSSAIAINQDVYVYATLIKTGESVQLTVAPGREVYVHLAQDVTGMTAGKVGVDVCGTKLAGGDGAYVKPEKPEESMSVTLKGSNSDANAEAEVIVFDLKKT